MAPSVSGEEVPAVTEPSALKAGLRSASASSEVFGRIQPSASTRRFPCSIGTSSASNLPAVRASLARLHVLERENELKRESLEALELEKARTMDALEDQQQKRETLLARLAERLETGTEELERTAVDGPLRGRLKGLGVTFFTESAVAEWHGDAATIRDLLDGSERKLPFDSLILATPNEAGTTLHEATEGSTLEVHSIGDCVAPRQANLAIYEGRKLGLAL